MIKIEYIYYGDTQFKRTFSDEGFKIRKVGTQEIYTEALDILSAPFQYEETDELINPIIIPEE